MTGWAGKMWLTGSCDVMDVHDISQKVWRRSRVCVQEKRP